MELRTYFDGTWHDGPVNVMSSDDHGIWLGSTVFDGARAFDGVTPDLEAHCARVNASAEALMIKPTVSTEDIVEIAREGLNGFDKGTAVYIRPMYWAITGDSSAIMPSQDHTGFSLVLKAVPVPGAETSTTLTTTRFKRPMLENNVVNAKAGCLYPNNARMIAEARAKGFGNALAQDAMGNVAETASANVFMVRDGEVLTPIANGTFLAGITRARHMKNLQEAGYSVREAVLSLEDFHQADEVFLSGNMAKVTPVTQFDDTHYQVGPVTRKARALYWDWAHSTSQY
ncbi:MAG: branched-chain amino acid aminotransferase [Pseudomonadota bacterium]